MTIARLFEQELSGLGFGTAATVTVSVPPNEISCEIIERNSLAVSFNSVRLVAGGLATADVTKLKRVGEELAARLTYLMEPISPIEIDEAACTLQLRSSPPQRDDDGRSYYELMVRRGGVSLMRYRKDNGGVRQRVPATLTREALNRLVTDLFDVVGGRISNALPD